jgi:CheY-like chemotaxis protein
MNLVINARDAMPDGGRLSIAVDTVNINADHVEANPAARIGQFACLTVSDTGSGIAPEIRHRIFEPFFTTKEVGKGTGLGLATVFGIVQQHNGWIEVSSEVGRGTTFRVFLPKLETEKTSEGAINGGDVVRGGHETILLVEDEPVVRSIAAKALRQYGYQVIEAENATSAMARWESTKGRIDLLVSDVVMPGGISGKELAEHLLRKKPELRVIYTTGHSAGKIGQQLQLEAGKNYLPKPYSFGELAMIIRQRLDERLPVVEQQLR